MTIKRTTELSLLVILVLNLLIIGSEVLLSLKFSRLSAERTGIASLRNGFNNSLLEHDHWLDSVTEHILDGWPFDKGLDQTGNPVMKWLKQNMAGHSGEYDRELISSAISAIESQYSVARRITEEADMEEKRALYLDEFVPALQALRPLVGQMTVNYNKRTAETEKSVNSLEKASFYFKAAASVLIMLSLLFISAVLGRLVINPLGAISAGIGKVGSGDLNGDLDYKKENEIGSIASNFNLMISSLRDIIADINSSTSAINGVVDDIKSSAERSNESSRAQSAKAAQIALTSEEMSRTIMDIARNASVASASSTDAMRVAEEGRQAAHRTKDIDNKVYESTITLSSMMENLSSKTGEIGSIVDVINDIADQTNLLALNAAIEAARAGEHGRGFGVVADEVRKLAERTIKATSEISRSIGDVVGEINSTNQSMGAVTAEVTQATKGINEVDESLGNIVKAISDSNDKIGQIAAAVEQQSSATEEVSLEIGDSSKLSTEIENMSSAVLERINSLAEVVTTLTGSISHLRA
jgi:methyl-accepting chemotaxis protein